MVHAVEDGAERPVTPELPPDVRAWRVNAALKSLLHALEGTPRARAADVIDVVRKACDAAGVQWHAQSVATPRAEGESQ